MHWAHASDCVNAASYMNLKSFWQSPWPEIASFKTSGSFVRVLTMEVCCVTL